MKKAILKSVTAVLLAATGFGLVACEQESKPSANEGTVVDRLKIRFDPALKQSERDLLVNDLYQLLQYNLQPKQGSYFSKTFGPQGTRDVVSYLDERVNYVIPESVNLNSRVTLNREIMPVTHATKAYTVASNIGTVLWFIAETARPQQLYFKVGNAKFPIDSSHVGIMQLGEGYTLKTAGGKYRFPQVDRVGTFIHEARHSDCTGGLSESDVERLRNNSLPLNRSCGHLHTVCPADHRFAGLAACDGHASWGAYAVEAIFSSSLAKNCANCTAEDKGAAEASALDGLSRVLNLEDLLAGKYGDPDMSSSGRTGGWDRVNDSIREFQDARSEDLKNATEEEAKLKNTFEIL